MWQLRQSQGECVFMLEKMLPKSILLCHVVNVICLPYGCSLARSSQDKTMLDR